ncbi:MAG: hypothetical protein CVU71_10915 [Deltaproteobacteria bacterium HGW-Deltaproteobacteria-6]|nr:MAG: hypothetical protein CVU71_10915 [Deltaproteobacteria bacterium HGW-Deltaproteobacteria-6]
MAINDISLTTGMRSNLQSLQNTVTLLDRTQNRLSTGKKVNTAMDNPVSYFAAQALNSRAAIIDGLKDAMGQAVQTITAADKGITALSTMIEQAKGLAQSAQSAAAGTTPTTIEKNATIEVQYSSVSATFVASGITYGQTFIVDGTYTFTVTSGGWDGTTSDLVADIGANTTMIAAGYTASVVGGSVRISNTGADVVVGDITGSAATLGKTEAVAHMETFSVSLTISDAAVSFSATGATAADAAAALATAIEGNTAIDDAGTLVSAAGAVTAAFAYIPSAEMTSIVGQYNTLRTQMDELAEDSGYKGKNLLSSDTMTVKFEGTTLDVVGFDASTGVAGLNIAAATATAWGATPANIDAAITALDAATTTLRSEASKLSGNLSIITVRQSFSTNMINTLNSGSDMLTLADSNEEGANMLMLQTRQSLSTTALSLSAQAAQSVLKLFG